MPAIGLDLGASKAVMALVAGGEPRLIPNREGSPLTPAALAPGPGGTLAWGHAALEGAEPAALMWLPRLGEATQVPFNGLEYTAGELAALFFHCLLREAEASLGWRPGRVVLALSPAFGQRQVALLRRAARRAGLLVQAVVPSPVAAALAYSWEHPNAEPRTMLVADFGASSLGVAVVRAFPGALTVLGQASEGWLGGEDVTQTIVAHLLRRLQRERGLLLDEDRAARRALRHRLRSAAERAKVALSTVERVTVSLAAGAAPLPAGLSEPLGRSQLEEMAAPLLASALETVERALAEAGLGAEGIHAVLLTGGAAQMPIWRAQLAQRLRRARFLRDANPRTHIALGAALWAGLLSQVHCPTCGLDLPLAAPACERCGTPLAGEARLACPRCFLPNDPAKLSCSKCGASLRAARRSYAPASRAGWGDGGLRCGRCGLVAPTGTPACPHCGALVAPFVGGLSRSDLGVERDDGGMDVLLPRGLPLPTQEVWRTFAAGGLGEPLEIAIYEGDKPIARQNEHCAVLRVDVPAGVEPGSRVQVGFRLDRDGLLGVRARLGDGSAQALDAWLE